jgi:hypothetical protein
LAQHLFKLQQEEEEKNDIELRLKLMEEQFITGGLIFLLE